MADSPGMGRSPSVTSQDSSRANEKKKKNRRPANTAFRQQRLKAWQPILTPKTVIPLFLGIGVLFAPIGGLLLYASAQVQEITIDYTTCHNDAPTDSPSQMPSHLVSTHFKSNNATSPPQWSRTVVRPTYDGVQQENETSICHIQFSTPEPLGPPVLFYYQLTNFYQNHRRYVNSFNDKQLKGDAVDGSSVNDSNCSPLTHSANGKILYPCGLIANSLFNDTFSNLTLLNVPIVEGDPDSNLKNETYSMWNWTGIAWGSDKDLYGKTKYNPDDIWPPPAWEVRYPNGYTDDNPPPDLKEMQNLQVWMRTASLPTFSKLAMRNDTTAMATGTYQVDILYNFPSEKYNGRKSIIISTRTVMGGRNPFLGIAYIVVSGICVVLGAVFAVTHLVRPRKLGDHTYLSWNKAPAGSRPGAPSTAISTGRDLGRPGDA